MGEKGRLTGTEEAELEEEEEEWRSVASDAGTPASKAKASTNSLSLPSPLRGEGLDDDHNATFDRPVRNRPQGLRFTAAAIGSPSLGWRVT